ncbi:MAG: NADH-quinone oxidoreductase subunit N [Syntrophomonadaceae bacterium]|nr:NADH-quinone oxidoreductase subunit N [Syntrophomonadaceae bacterium]
MDYTLLVPEIFVASLACLLLILGLIAPKGEKRGLVLFAIVGIIASIVVVAAHFNMFDGFLGRMYLVDSYASYFKVLFLVSVLLVCLTTTSYFKPLAGEGSEAYAIMLFATLGMMILVSAGELITLYVGMELMTISFYILTANLAGEDARSSEAGLKYLILGAVSSAVMLYGFTLLYGVTGTTLIHQIALHSDSSPAFWLGVVFALSGFGFKVAMVPFHMWAPEIYEGAPPPVTIFLAVASKAAGFAVFVRVFLTAFPYHADHWVPIIAFLAAITMILGNLAAIPQQNIKRMLAYSSIAQAGYLLVGLVAANQLGVKGILFYTMIYVFANVGAFAVTIVFNNVSESDDIADYSGLAQRSPLLAATLLICMLSMAGIPPLAGFAGKFYLFSAVIDQGFLWLAIIGLVMSMISVYYYLSVARVMYLGQVTDYSAIKVNGSMKLLLYGCMILSIILGVYPDALAQIANTAAKFMF